MLYIKHVVPYYLKKAPSVFAISESTKNDLIRYYGMKPELVTVNYNGFNPEKLNGDMTLEQLQERFGILKKYMLYIARVEHPGKNHLNLLKAYEQLPEEIKNEYELVCAGSKWSNSEAVLSYHSGMKDRANIHFPGFVSGNDMAALYKNASLYVFPSLYEGFGLPLLEAFAAGVPVVCSDRSSLPEIGADAVRCFNPNDPAGIASTIQSVLSDPPLMIQMIYLGKERLKDFSWDKHASIIMESLTSQR
jgi:glycosyltransferase involved in cell wall biosynthesis